MKKSLLETGIDEQTDVVEPQAQNDRIKELVEILINATPSKMIQYIDFLEQDQDQDFSKMAFISKVIFVKNFIRDLNVPVRKFRCTQKRYRTELHGESGMVIGISKVDSKDMDAAYVKLYNNHRDLFLKLYDKYAT